MSSCCDPSGYRGVFSRRTARRNADSYRKGGLDATARELVGHVRSRGVSGLSVLEVGGGVGAIQLELLRAGAAHATNVELSPEYEDLAAALARDAGVGDRIDRRVGDFVDLAPDIAPADIVVLHRVVCCYPHLERLLAPAADRSRRALALTYPRSNALIRLAVRVGNLWFRVTRCTFRVFGHAPEQIERIAVERGLQVAFRKRGFIWEAAVFERASR